MNSGKKQTIELLNILQIVKILSLLHSLKRCNESINAAYIYQGQLKKKQKKKLVKLGIYG